MLDFCILARFWLTLLPNITLITISVLNMLENMFISCLYLVGYKLSLFSLAAIKFHDIATRSTQNHSSDNLITAHPHIFKSWYITLDCTKPTEPIHVIRVWDNYTRKMTPVCLQLLCINFQRRLLSKYIINPKSKPFRV